MSTRSFFSAFFTKKNLSKFAILTALAVAVLLALFISVPADADAFCVKLTKATRWARFAVSIVWTSIFFAWLAGIRAWLRCAILAVVFVPCTFFCYTAHVLKFPYSYLFLADILETNFSEASSFFDLTATGAIIFAVVALVVLTVILGKLKLELAVPAKKIWKIVVPVALLAVSFTPIKPAIYPMFVLQTIQHDARLYLDSERDFFTKLKQETPKNVPLAPENAPIVFLHLGESVRADHAPFNGYERNTFPRVNEEFCTGDVVSFPRCTSFSNSTRLSSVAILTPMRSGDPVVRHGALFTFANAAGVKTIGFFSSMTGWSNNDINNSTITCMTSAIREKYFEEGTSDKLLPLVFEKANTDELRGKTLFFYYGEGSHTPSTRYNREKYSRWTPAATDYEENERHINAYDNCLVATDDFIGNAIDALREKNAIYIYVADHGEMLGEDGFWSRNPTTALRPETRRVLFFIWASKKFQTTFPEKWAALKANAKNLACVSHDNIYHSVLSALCTKSPFYDETLDLFSTEAVAFPSEIPKFPNRLKSERDD